MARKNGNKAHRRPNLNIPKNWHFMYSTHEFGEDATVVRYLGEQDGDSLLCFLPDGYSMWIHLHHLYNMPKASLVAA